MKPYEVKVAPEDVTETVNNGMRQGWRFLDSRMMEDGKMLLVFDISGGAIPHQQYQPRPQPYKQSTFHRTCTVIVAGISALFIGLIVFIAAIGGLGADATPTHSPGSVQATIRPNQAVSQPEAYTANNLPDIMKASMRSIDFPTNAIAIYSDTIIVNAPATSNRYDEVVDYRLSYVGALTGTVVSAYEDERTIINPPSTIQINFANGAVVDVRVVFSYADAVAFRAGQLTSNQCVNRWQVE